MMPTIKQFQSLLILVFMLSAFWSGAARAECLPNGVSRAITARLDKKALPLLVDRLVRQLPDSIELPEEPYTIYDCPDGFDDFIATAKNGQMQVHVRDVDVFLDDGAIEVEAEVDITGQAVLDLQICAAPDATCNAVIEVQNVRLFGRLLPSVQNCTASLDVETAEIWIAPYSTVAELSDCGAYEEIWGYAYNWLRSTIVEVLSDTLETKIRELVPDTVAGFTTDLLAQRIEMAGIGINLSIDDIDITPESVTGVFSARSVSLNGVAACVGEAMDVPRSEEPHAPPEMGESMLGLALSQPFLQQTVHAAWQAGWLCFDSRAYDLDLSAFLADFSPETNVEAVVSVRTPPIIDLGRSDDHTAFALAADEMEAQLTIGNEEHSTLVLAHMGALLGGRVHMDRALQALTLEVTEIGSSSMSIEAPGTELIFSEGAIAELVRDAVLPAFVRSRGTLPITSGMFMFAPVAARVDQIEVSNGHARADLELCAINADDTAPPYTILTKPPQDPSPAEVTLQVASLDEETPPEFMRHRVTIDGVEQPELMGGTTIVLTDQPAGEHSIELAAVDLAGNVDPTPLQLSISIDDEPPLVVLEESPIGVLEEGPAEIRFKATDNWSNSSDLVFEYVLERLRDDGSHEILEQAELWYERTLSFDSLPEDSIVTVEITAVDEAGNRGTASTTFGVNLDPTFGCKQSRAVIWAIPAVLVLGLRRRRRLG